MTVPGVVPGRRIQRREWLDQFGAVVVGGDYQGLGIVRSLGTRGIPVCVVDDERSIAARSRYTWKHVHTASLRHEQATRRALIQLAETHPVRGWVLYPTRDETVAAIAAHREELAEFYRIPTAGWGAIRAVWDKRETYRCAAELGIDTPRTWVPTDVDGVDDIPTDAPVVIKPAIKERFFYTTGVKAWRAENRTELVRAYQRAAEIVPPGEVIVQELIPGDGTRQYAYCVLFKGGVGLADMTVIRRRQHPSDFGRASTLVETVSTEDLAEPSTRFLNGIDYYGLAELEYKHDPRDGRFKLLDVNARTWGYHTVGAAAGVDFSYLLYRDQVGLPVRPSHARPGVRWVRMLTDLPNAARDILAGSLRVGEYARSLRRVDEEAVFSLRDPLPGLYELALVPYLAMKRGL